MTEQEAKTKWCPFAQVTDRREVASYNRLPMKDFEMPTPKSARCIGSACMAWRKDMSAGVTEWVKGDLAQTVKPIYGGFCGIAGKP